MIKLIMKFFKVLTKKVSLNRRFLVAFEKLEKQGFAIFNTLLKDKIVDEKIERQIRCYKKNTKLLETLDKKTCQTKLKYILNLFQR